MPPDGLSKIAASQGCARVEWTTDAGNRGARQFYEALRVKPLTSKIFYRAAAADLANPHSA